MNAVGDTKVRLEAVRGMLIAFVQSVSDDRVGAFVARTQSYSTETLQVACVRLQENATSTPNVARLRATCAEIEAENRRRDPDKTLESDWLEEIINQGVRWWDRRSGEVGRSLHTQGERQFWRDFAQEKLDEQWTQNEVCNVITGARELGWMPPRLVRRLKRPKSDYDPDVEVIDSPLLTGGDQ